MGALRMHGARTDRPLRYLDKSQTYSVKPGYIDALLTGADARFVLLVRNPFAMIWRAATGPGVIGTMPAPIEDKVELAMQHWGNLHRAALAEEHRVAMGVWRYEDVLTEPDRQICEICEHIGIDFRPDIMPGPDDRLPPGSAPDAAVGLKWYPIRPANNTRYLDELPGWAYARIAEECAELVDRFGYAAPRAHALHAHETRP